MRPELGLLAAEVGAAAPASVVSLRRATHTVVQSWDGPPERILPLLTPRGEMAWAVGWEPDIRWQAPGNGEGTLFVTRAAERGEAVWVLQTFDAARPRVAYSSLVPGALLVEVSVTLSPLSGGRTRGEVRYTFTALSEAGNARLAERTDEHFAAFMRDWEQQLNHFLRTGRKLGEPSP